MTQQAAREKTRPVQVGSVTIGGGAPVVVQSMTNVPMVDDGAGPHLDPSGNFDQILRLKDAGGVGAEAVEPQCGPHPRQQLASAEGFGDVVVRAKVQRFDLVRLGGAGRQHDDGRHEFLAHIVDELAAVAVGQAQVQDDEVGQVGGEDGFAQLTGGGHIGLVAVGVQQGIDEAADGGFVFNDEDLEFVVAHFRCFPPDQWIRPWIRSPARSGWWCLRRGGSRP